MTGAVLIRRGGREAALGAAGLLSLSAVITILVPRFGAVATSDGSATASVPAALWMALLPALVVIAATLLRPDMGLAAAVGAGMIGLARLLADIPVVVSPDSVARPDLFVETTDRALPFSAGAGGYLLLLADVLAIIAGVFAAQQLSGLLSFRPDDADPRDAGSDQGAAGGGDEWATVLAGYDDMGARTGRSRRNNAMVSIGFVGVLALVAGALVVPYSGGYLNARFVPVAVDFIALVGALLLAVLAAVAVLVAAVLPRRLALALLAGAAASAAVPALTALVAVTRAPTGTSISVWFTLIGAALLIAAALLPRVRIRPVLDDEPDGRPPSVLAQVLVGIVALVAGAFAVLAALLPQLDTGGLDVELHLTDGSAIPPPVAFGVAAVPLAAAGVLALIPRFARAGRAMAMVAWAGVAFALAGALQVLSDDGLGTARLMHLLGIGSGLWCGVTAMILAALAAVLAAVTSRRAAEASFAIADEESVTAVRGIGIPVAIGLGVLAVLASCLPVFTTAGQIQSPTIVRVYAVDAWGAWAVLLAVLGAIWGSALTRRPSVAIALCLGAAAVSAVRLVIPKTDRGADGFAVALGFAVQIVLVAALVAAAGVFAVLAHRIREFDVGGAPSGGAPSGGAAAAYGSTPSSPAGALRGSAPSGRAPSSNKKPAANRGKRR